MYEVFEEFGGVERFDKGSHLTYILAEYKNLKPWIV